MTIDMTSDVTRDVHAVSDTRQLGARLPRDLLTQSPTLSGVVFEATSEGPLPLSGAFVGVDGVGGDNPATASTVTDSEGRYVLCGLDSDPSAWVFARKTGYQQFGARVLLTGSATTLDIQLR